MIFELIGELLVLAFGVVLIIVIVMIRMKKQRMDEERIVAEHTLSRRQVIKPNYYNDEDGHDIFWEMEHGKYPYEQALGFCLINSDKYRRRAGKKTASGDADLEKAKEYDREAIKLRDLNRMGELD